MTTPPLRIFPSIVNGYELTPDMGYFSVVIPEATINLVDNPSFEYSTTGYSALLTGSINIDSTYARRGIRSLRVVPAAVNEGVRKTISAGLSSNTDYCWSFDIYIPLNRIVQASVEDVGAAWSVNKRIRGDGKWHRIFISFRYPSGSFYLTLKNPYNVFTFYTDGWQLENKAYPTTYCDGDLTGYVYNQTAFYWNGIPHASASQRILQTGAGGREYKLSELGFRLLGYTGLGMPDIENISTDLWQGGAYYQRTIEKTRSFTIIGAIGGKNTSDLNKTRNSLSKAFYDRGLDTDQPVLIRYYPADGGEEDAINIPSFIENGLQGVVDNKYQERIALSFKQFNPVMTKETFASSPISMSTPLNGNTFYRKKADGTWTTFITTSITAGLNYAICDQARGIVYLYGQFASLNGIANTSRIAQYIDGQITAMGTGALNGQIDNVRIAPNGDLYICGDFTQVGGVAKTAKIAKWNYATQAWESLYTGTDPSAQVYDIAIDLTGYVYATGAFTTISGVAANRIAFRTPSGTWTAIGTGLDSAGLRLAVDRNNRVYIAGTFANANGINTGTIARVTTTRTSFELLVTGVIPSASTGDRIAIGSDGSIYFASRDGVGINFGSFTSIIARYNGSGFYPLQGNIVGSFGALDLLTITPGGTLIVGGDGFYLTDLGADDSGIFSYRSGKWIPWERESGIPAENGRPLSWTVTKGGEVFITGYEDQYLMLAGNTTVVNSLMATKQTEFIFKGPLTVHKIANNRTNQTIYFNNMKVLPGETVILKNNGSRHTIYSSIGRNMSGYIDKDAGGLGIAEGTNLISMVVNYALSVDASNLSALNNIPYLGNVSDRNSDFGKLYFSLVYVNPNYSIVIYKDAARTQQVAHTAFAAANVTHPIIEDGGSGLTGYILTFFGGGASIPDIGYAIFGLTNLKYTQETLNLIK